LAHLSSLMRVVRPSTRPGTLLPIALAVVALPAVAFGALPSGKASPAVAAANSTTYTDSTGEDPAAPDITTIVVSNDDAGILSLRINISNRSQLSQDMGMILFVDTDNNPATGSPDLAGVDYVFELIRNEINLFKWDGTTFTRRFGDPSAVTLSFSYQAGITVRISAAELGNTSRFNFIVEVSSGIAFDPATGAPDFTNAKSDVAPGGGAGLYPYTVTIAKPTIIVRTFTTTPAGAPVAGKPFTMRLLTARSDTGAVIQNGRVRCVGSAGTTLLRAQTSQVTSGGAVCTWLIPKGAKGKTFRGSVAVSFEGLNASRSISRRIR
jgi:hypothetical protein